MGKRRFLVSLMTDDNDFQIEQANSAQQTAAKLGVEIQIAHAGNDASTQNTQILRAIQVPEEDRPHAIIFEPLAASAGCLGFGERGIGWAVLNRDASYIAELRSTSKVPVFGVSSDQVEVGRIAGRQCTALPPRSGSILYLEGPSHHVLAQERESGL